MPRGSATKLFRLAEGCEKKSIRIRAKRLEPVLRARTRKSDRLIEILYPWKKLTYVVPGGSKTVAFEKVDEAALSEIIGTILAGTRENRGVLKAAESILFASSVADLPFPEESETAETSESS